VLINSYGYRAQLAYVGISGVELTGVLRGLQIKAHVNINIATSCREFDGVGQQIGNNLCISNKPNMISPNIRPFT